MEHGVMWSVKLPCSSSVSSQRAREEEEKEAEELLSLHYRDSVTLIILDTIRLKKRKFKTLFNMPNGVWDSHVPVVKDCNHNLCSYVRLISHFTPEQFRENFSSLHLLEKYTFLIPKK